MIEKTGDIAAHNLVEMVQLQISKSVSVRHFFGYLCNNHVRHNNMVIKLW